MKRVNPFNSVFLGFQYFLSHKKLWTAPLLTVLISFIALAFLFFLSAYYLWPITTDIWYVQVWGVFRSIGTAFLGVVLAWLFILPVIFGVVYQTMIKRVLLDEQININELGVVSSFHTGLMFVVKTLNWRIRWVIAILVALFLLPPIVPIIGYIAMSHGTALDATGMTKILQGEGIKEQVVYMTEKRGDLLLIGLIGGIGCFFLIPTVIGGMFLIPGIYIGTAFFVTQE